MVVVLDDVLVHFIVFSYIYLYHNLYYVYVVEAFITLH